MLYLRKIIRSREIGAAALNECHDLDLRYIFPIRAGQTDDHDNSAPAQSQQNIDGLAVGLLDEAKREAEEIKNQAYDHAAKIMENAQTEAATEAEEIKAKAADDGYHEGYQAAIAEAQQEAEKIRAEARAVLEQAEQARQEKLAKLKGEIIDLALDIAKKISMQELEVNQNIVVTIVEESLQLINNRQNVVLWVNPQEQEICEKYREHFLKHLTAKAELQIIADEAVEPGGCIVETEYSKVDAQTSTRWQNLLSSIKKESS